MKLKNISWQEAQGRKNCIINSWNFGIGDVSKNDILFSLLPNEHFEMLPSESSMWDVLIRVRVFSNKSQCKGAGISKEINNGFSSFVIGKKKSWITILKNIL